MLKRSFMNLLVGSLVGCIVKLRESENTLITFKENSHDRHTS